MTHFNLNFALRIRPSMSLAIKVSPGFSLAEQAFRVAFERLKRNCPERLPPGTPVSQNNVAREAGCDPSALRKKRFPSLVAEIQQWIADHRSGAVTSPRQKLLAQRAKNRTQKEVADAMKLQRDHALSLLAEADCKIVELTMELSRLRVEQLAPNVIPLRPTDGERR